MDRRRFIHTGLVLGTGFAGFQCSPAVPAPEAAAPPNLGYGPLVADPNGFIDLPAGFSYREVSRTGETMDDGFPVPGLHDGMAAFPGPGGTTILIRNHELSPNSPDSPFGPDGALLSQVPDGRIYDRRCTGGTTTLVYDTTAGQLVRHHLSLTGTIRNCAGGPTPWGSWVTCEESVLRAGDDGRERDHGYAFEVPSTADGLVVPVPLTAMGRFNHEAIAVDPASGAVYETEDRANGLVYRFLPDERGNLQAGGRLQALVVREQPGVDTANHESTLIRPGQPLEVDWIGLDNVEAPDDDLRTRGQALGAATFSRGEGIWFAGGWIYFAATSGGQSEGGQIWRYRPSEVEGTPEESDAPGTLELFAEPNDRTILDMADNISMAPFGDLIICEDGPDGNFVRGLTPEGEIYSIAHNVRSATEFAGAVFSPDGSTLFVNSQQEGVTLAITGPWG
jgi:hypothetical protein